MRSSRPTRCLASRRHAVVRGRSSTSASTGFAPGYRLYETQDDWIQIAAVSDEHWDALCRVVGVADAGTHSPDREAVEPQIDAGFRTRPSVSWSHLLDDAGMPNEIPVDTQGGLLALYDADAERLGLVVDYEHPIMGAMRQFGHLVNFSETPDASSDRRRVSASTAARSSASSGTRPRRWRSSRPTASSTGPTTTTAGVGERRLRSPFDPIGVSWAGWSAWWSTCASRA